MGNFNTITVYLPIGIQDRARELKIPFSSVCKAAILAEIDRVEKEQISGVIKKVDFHRVEDATPEIDWMQKHDEG